MCVPLGGMTAGVIAARVLPTLGWHALYLIGGGAPMLVALLLLFALPESPRFLARHSEKRSELVRLLGRMGHIIPDGSIFHSAESHTQSTGAIRSLFAPALSRDTLGLWLAFFSCLNGVYLVFGWLPSMLTARGLNLSTASSGLAAYNFGGVLGVLTMALCVTAFGSRKPMLWGAAAGSASAFLLRFVDIAPSGDHTLLIAGLGLHGLFVNGVQTTMFALASHIYPTRIRATGIACAATAGRLGGLLGSLGGAMIIQAGSGAYVMYLTVAMGGAFLGLALVRNHCPGRAEATAAYIDSHLRAPEPELQWRTWRLRNNPRRDSLAQ